MERVTIYTTTYCSFCSRAIQLLEDKGIPYLNLNIDGDKKKELYKETGQNTVPYIFIDDNFIGGCSELQELDASGKLDEMYGKSRD